MANSWQSNNDHRIVTVEDYREVLATSTHSYIAKFQGKYLKDLKGTMTVHCPRWLRWNLQVHHTGWNSVVSLEFRFINPAVLYYKLTDELKHVFLLCVGGSWHDLTCSPMKLNLLAKNIRSEIIHNKQNRFYLEFFQKSLKQSQFCNHSLQERIFYNKYF